MRPARLVPRWGEFADALEDVRQEQWRSVLHAADNHDREVGDQHQPAHAAARPGNRDGEQSETEHRAGAQEERGQEAHGILWHRDVEDRRSDHEEQAGAEDHYRDIDRQLDDEEVRRDHRGGGEPADRLQAENRRKRAVISQKGAVVSLGTPVSRDT